VRCEPFITDTIVLILLAFTYSDRNVQVFVRIRPPLPEGADNDEGIGKRRVKVPEKIA
jgi:hypothetical protein